MRLTWVIAFNDTFKKYFSYIVAVSFIGGGNWSNRRKLPTCSKLLTNFITKCCIEYTSLGVEFELTTLVVIGADCTVSCKSNYHTMTTTSDFLSLVQRLLCDSIYQNISLQLKKKHLRKLPLSFFIIFRQYQLCIVSLSRPWKYFLVHVKIVVYYISQS